MSAPPIWAVWDGESFVPMERFRASADQHYEPGKAYALVEHEQRSIASHNHEFAWLHDAWLNLPEDIAGDFPSEDHLRKFGLIKTGWCDKTQIVFSSPQDAKTASALISWEESYVLCEVVGCVLTRYTAKSQRMRGRGAMKKADFEASKKDLIAYVSGLIGVTPEELVANAGRAA